MHHVINIAHLESYRKSPPELGERPKKHLAREDFEAKPEWVVEKIIAEDLKPQGKKKIRKYLVRWEGYGPDWDLWLTKYQLQNAPKVLRSWEKRRVQTKAIHIDRVIQSS